MATKVKWTISCLLLVSMVQRSSAQDSDINAANETARNPLGALSDEVCYDELGCFSISKGELGFMKTLPAPPAAINATFTLYSDQLPQGLSLTYDDQTGFSDLNLDDSRSTPSWLTFIAHGFGASSKARWVEALKDAVLGDIGGYVVTVDWSRGAALPNYIQAAVNTQIVARMAAVLTHRLLDRYPETISLNRTHWIGHSLGAQMAHFYAAYIQELENQRPARITALDAAAPEFEDHEVFVNKNDADFVDALHTSAGSNIITGELGMSAPIGHVDFYANGGSQQPGCGRFRMGCSHSRAHSLYIEARRDTSCRFTSFACEGGLAEIRRGNCVKILDNSSELGIRTSQLAGRGVQYFKTNSRSPYCIPSTE